MTLEVVLTDDEGYAVSALAENITVEDLKLPLAQFVERLAHPLTDAVFYAGRRKWIDNNPPPGV